MKETERNKIRHEILLRKEDTFKNALLVMRKTEMAYRISSDFVELKLIKMYREQCSTEDALQYKKEVENKLVKLNTNFGACNCTTEITTGLAKELLENDEGIIKSPSNLYNASNLIFKELIKHLKGKIYYCETPDSLLHNPANIQNPEMTLQAVFYLLVRRLKLIEKVKNHFEKQLHIIQKLQS